MHENDASRPLPDADPVTMAILWTIGPDAIIWLIIAGSLIGVIH